MCFSVPIAVYLVPLGAHLSADLSVCMSECRPLESGKLSVPALGTGSILLSAQVEVQAAHIVTLPNF